MLAAPIGLLRIPARIMGFRLVSRPWGQLSGRVFRGALVIAFVASVPGKSRQSLFFGLFSFGFFDYMEGLAGVRWHPVGCVGVCLACSVTHRRRYGFR